MNEQKKGQAIIAVRGLKKHFPIKKGSFSRSTGTVRAVDGVSFEIMKGEVFGLVGESGCGKSTLGMTILRAYDTTAGEIIFTDKNGTQHPIHQYSYAKMKPLRREMQVVFQDPFSSLSPRMNVRDIIAEPLLITGAVSRRDMDDRVAAALQSVGLNPSYMRRYPHAFSGGQRQRISIARALVLDPSFVVADEAVSALDVSVQAQILELLRELKSKHDQTYLFVSHDLGVVNYFCDRVAVMYVGHIVEIASAREIFINPRHPYTEALTQAIPIPDPKRRKEVRALPGEVADPANPPSGCPFHPRCAYAQGRCAAERPELRNVPAVDGGAHTVACHFSESLDLAAAFGHMDL